jgi:hypothetical protein
VLSANSPVCQGDVLTLSTTSVCGNYTWTAPNGAQATTTTNTLIVTSGSALYQAGNWTVVCTNVLTGCSSLPSLPVNVTIAPVPVSVPSNNGPVCAGSPVTLFGNTVPNATYYWYNHISGGVGTLISTNQNHTVYGLARVHTSIIWL